MSTVLEDILDSGLTTDEVRVRVQTVFEVARGEKPNRTEQLQRSRTPGTAKNLIEFYELVRQAILDNEMRNQVPKVQKVTLTEEEPDVDAETETITFSLVQRGPGAFGQGAPFEAKVKNLRPRLREEKDDPDHPGYRMSITGYWYDNLVRFTCWARTNKVANTRALWFEDLMEEYSWWFKVSGVDRVLFYERQADIVTDVNGIKWYGRPIDFYVRTERLRVFQEKKIEEILIKAMVKTQ